MSKIYDNDETRGSSSQEQKDITRKIGGLEYVLIAENEIIDSSTHILLTYQTNEALFDDFIVVAENIKGEDNAEFKISFTMENNISKYITPSYSVSSSTAKNFYEEIERKTSNLFKLTKAGTFTGNVVEYFELDPSVKREDKIKMIQVYLDIRHKLISGTCKLYGRRKFNYE